MLDYFLTKGDERIDNFGALTWSDDIESIVGWVLTQRKKKDTSAKASV